jgi:hypothetical protein
MAREGRFGNESSSDSPRRSSPHGVRIDGGGVRGLPGAATHLGSPRASAPFVDRVHEPATVLAADGVAAGFRLIGSSTC